MDTRLFITKPLLVLLCHPYIPFLVLYHTAYILTMTFLFSMYGMFHSAHFPPPKLRLGWSVIFDSEGEEDGDAGMHGGGARELTLITVPALLVERYVYGGGLWDEEISGEGGKQLSV